MADNVWNARDVCDHLDGNDVSGCMHARVCARRSPQVHLRSATGRSHDAPCRLVMGTRRTLTGSSALSCDTAPAFTMASNSTPSIVRTFGCLQHNHRQHSHSHYVHGVSSSTRAGGRAGGTREHAHLHPGAPRPAEPNEQGTLSLRQPRCLVRIFSLRVFLHRLVVPPCPPPAPPPNVLRVLLPVLARFREASRLPSRREPVLSSFRLCLSGQCRLSIEYAFGLRGTSSIRC